MFGGPPLQATAPPPTPPTPTPWQTAIFLYVISIYLFYITNVLGFYGDRELGRDSGIGMGTKGCGGGLEYYTMTCIARHFGQEEIIVTMYKLNGTDPASNLSSSCLLPMSIFYIVLPFISGVWVIGSHWIINKSTLTYTDIHFRHLFLKQKK